MFKELLEAEYKRGFDAGVMYQKNEQLDDANRRQEYLFDEGKKMGYEKGSTDGFCKGHKVGYHDGYEDGKIEGKYGNVEEIDLDELVQRVREIKEDKDE